MTLGYVLSIVCILGGLLEISLAQQSSPQKAPAGSDIKIDLRHGVVRGNNPLFVFLSRPTRPTNGSCQSQAVLRVAFPSPDAELRVRLTFGESPRLWTLHISDTPTGDGFGGTDVTTSNNAELNIHNKQLRLYGNELPTSVDAAMNGGRLMKVYDNFVKRDIKVTMEISDERLQWKRGQSSEVIESPFLFTLSGQVPSYGSRDDFVYIGLNRVVGGTYRTGSGLCRAEIKMLQPLHRCSQNPNCHPDAKCINTRRSYRCKCKPGFNGDGKVCKDENECAYDNGGCVHTCINAPGNYSCACKAGFALMDDGKNCRDINECFNNKGSCSQQCINSLGSFQCECSSGFSLDESGRKCMYGEWCRVKFGCSHGCKTHSIGSKVECYCREGYILHSDGKTCLRTCLHGNGGCHHRCNDSSSGPLCSCAPNYFLNVDKKTCTATCAVKNGGCERKCIDTPKGPVCSCPVGFKLHQDGKTCLDVNECEAGTAGCSHQCENTRGSYECICPPGYKVAVDDKSCIDINECNLKTMCDHQCENIPGSFVCHCSKGYQKFGMTHCADRNECAHRNGGCAHKCTNNDGSYKCSCVPGFKLHPNKHDCIDARQCTQLSPKPNVRLSCSNQGNEQHCVLRCQKKGRLISKSVLLNVTSLPISCGPSTGFRWRGIDNKSLPECSYTSLPPSYARIARVVLVHESCSVSPSSVDALRFNMTQTFNSEKKYKCKNRCQVNYVSLKCGTRRKKFFRKYTRRNKKSLLTAEFEFQMNTKKAKGSCDAQCTGERTRKRFNRAFKKLRRVVKRNKLILRLDGKEYKAIKKSLKSDKLIRPICPEGTNLLNQTCVGCRLGTFFNRKKQKCELCSPDTYQDEEGKSDCKECPNKVTGAGIDGASSQGECSDRCNPGTFSQTGKKPCQPCGVGTFQPNFGRISCVPCGGGLSTKGRGSTDFSQCLAKVVCKPGSYYSTASHACVPCQKGFYQPVEGQEFCLACPGKTSTDFAGSKSPDDCKDQSCGRYMGDFYGIVESPNYPGNYPIDVQCVWKIRPEKRRLILVIVPEIDLSDGDKCEDIIIMRKSKSAYSQSTFETCESRHRPIAFTARSKKLWIQFKSNKNNTAKGFSIPFVTYNEEYHSLIEDIVRDGRLYSSKQHQQIFKDRQLLTALLEVIATPYKYLNYANVSHTMFPQSFIRLLTPKVRRFFDP